MSAQLVPLGCTACGGALQGEPFDRLFVCPACGAGAELAPTGLVRVEVVTVAPGGQRRADRWAPAWLVEATVRVAARTDAAGRTSPAWEHERGFVIPAFTVPLEDLVRLARGWAAQPSWPPLMGGGPGAPLHGGTLSRADALTLCRHLVVGEEVGRADQLASLDVTVQERSLRLLALPFTSGSGRLRCVVTGVEVST